MRAGEILIIVLVAMYAAASAYIIYQDYSSKLLKPGEKASLSSFSPSSNSSVYLTYTVKGYVFIAGSSIYIDREQIYITLSPQLGPQANATTGNTSSAAQQGGPLYDVRVAGDPAISWALSKLPYLGMNASSAPATIPGQWVASDLSSVFINISRLGTASSGSYSTGPLAGRSYLEYTYKGDDGELILRIDRELKIPLECFVNTSWARLSLRIVSAS